MKIYPAPEEEYTHESWEILVDLEDDLNDWGVRHGSIRWSGVIPLQSLAKANVWGLTMPGPAWPSSLHLNTCSPADVHVWDTMCHECVLNTRSVDSQRRVGPFTFHPSKP